MASPATGQRHRVRSANHTARCLPPMTPFLPDDLAVVLRGSPRTWLVTSAAGFIGSHLVEALLYAGQTVRGLDNFSTGRMENVEGVRGVAPHRYAFSEGDIRDLDTCRTACEGVNVVFHQAALGSVPRSIADPLANHAANVNGTLNVLVAARDAGVERLVHASSNSVYGDSPTLPKVEAFVGTPLSPYSVSKRTGELYARTFADHYALSRVGARYFNVSEARQDPAGPYAAVLPQWVGTLLAGDSPTVYGDGETSRDFCYVANVVQATLRAGLAGPDVSERVYNVAVGEQTTLRELYDAVSWGLVASGVLDRVPAFETVPIRPGDIRHSLADTSAARADFGYNPTHRVEVGLREALVWYVADLTREGSLAP